MNGIAPKIVHDRDLATISCRETYLQIWHKAGEYRRDLGGTLHVDDVPVAVSYAGSPAQ